MASAPDDPMFGKQYGPQQVREVVRPVVVRVDRLPQQRHLPHPVGGDEADAVRQQAGADPWEQEIVIE